MKVILKKSEIAEGITPELIKSINIKKQSSPVMIEPGDEPVKLMPCDKGFWIKNPDGSLVKDALELPVKIDERAAVIGRARYLLNHSGDEKRQKAIALTEKWKREVKERIEKLCARISDLKSVLAEGSTYNTLAKALTDHPVPGSKTSTQFFNEKEQELEALEPGYIKCVELLQQERFIELITIFKIARFDNPMLTAHFDNAEEIKTVVNVFGAKALENWDGDMLIKYAEIEIEKQYAL